MRACLYATLLCSLGVSACDARFWQSFNEANPENCATSGTACASGMACSQLSQICELLPDVTSVEPALASGAGGARVRVHGQNFNAKAGVWFGQPPGAEATAVAVLSDTLLEATLPANPGDSWAVPVTVGTPGVSATRSGLFSYYAAQLSFVRSKVELLSSAQALDTADFNQDGKLDIASMSTTARSGSILLSNGDGTFTAGPSQLISSLSTAVHGVDVNNDKYPDLLILSNAGLDVFLSNQGKSFQAARRYATDAAANPGAEGGSFGDWNRDGAIDIAVNNKTVDHLTILFNDGQGGFDSRYEIANSSLANSTISGEFTGDGKDDLISLSTTGPLQLFVGDGGGGLDPSSKTAADGCDPFLGQAADLNEDGRLDLVFSCLSDKSLRVAFSKASGGFEPANTPLKVFLTVPSITVADYDGDHHLDLGIYSPSEAAFIVLKGDGAGSFVQGSVAKPPQGPSGRTSAVTGDFNSDGKPDFLLASSPPDLFTNGSK